jgi:Tol biopolymer transport system component
VRFLLLFSMSFSVELEERFSAYMAALNRHDVEAALSMTSLDLQRRDLLEWEASMEARSEFEIVSIRGDRLTADLFRVRPDGTELGVIAGGPRRDYNQSYAPDGTRIAFDSHRDGRWDSDDGLWEVWLMNADGSGRRAITNDEVNDWGPTWSPDGGTIVFLSGMDNVYDVYLMNPDGSNVRRLTHWTDTARR